mgnify:CR=1 FL=1
MLEMKWRTSGVITSRFSMSANMMVTDKVKSITGKSVPFRSSSSISNSFGPSLGNSFGTSSCSASSPSELEWYSLTTFYPTIK